jgi:HK97 family phage prohead protease
MSYKEFKSFPFVQLKAGSADGRTRKGICAVFGNVDSIGDRIHHGAFAKTIQENQKSVKHLWNHDFWNPPIASIVGLKELTRDELPPEVLAKAPEATGGLMVERKYYEGNPLSDWVLKAIDAGDINEMSFAYDVIKYEITEEETGFEDMPKRRIRELKELKLFDTSDVNWGCNGATVAVGAKRGEIMPLGLIYSNLLAITEEIKAGRRNSDSDEKLINLIHSTTVDLGAICQTDDEKSTVNSEGKPEEKAEAVTDTSLNQNWLDLQKLELGVFEL